MLTLACLAAPLSAEQPPQTPPQQKVPPVEYETRVDIILVDVNVLDKQGKPVEGLGPDDFRVWVGGRPRPIQTVQFITPPVAAADEPAAAAAPRVSSNQQVGRGRLFMLVVDEANLSIADARALDGPLEKFFSSLGPRDLVGLVTIPLGGPRIDFTAESIRVRGALDGITGMSAPTSSLDRYSVGLTEAFYFEAGSSQWGDVVARECAGLNGIDLFVCQQDVEADARGKVIDARHRAGASLGALYDVIQQLGRVEGPKTLVFVSGGLVLERQDAMSVAIAAEAAAANTTIYVLHLERPLVDASAARPSPTLSEDLALGRQGLEMMAGRARGDVFQVPTSSEFALARIVTETSGYYLLGVDAEPEDRDGRTHQVKVELASSLPRGLTLRSRREFRYDRAAAAGGATDEERLGALLGSPATADELPIRASAYTMGDPARGTLQLHVAAEIGAAATAEETMVVGFVLLDGKGRTHRSAGHRLVLQPIDPAAPSPLRYAGTLTVEPGDYTMKLAAIDPDGRRGSIEHPVSARLTKAGPLLLGDLFVLDAPRSGPVDFRPEVLTRLTGQRVVAYCEMYGSEAGVFERTGVAVEIAASDDGPALLGGQARAAGTEATRRMVQVAMSTSMLPPGDYVVRVVLTDSGAETARLLRGFRVERPSAAAGPGGSGPLFSALTSVVPKPVFERERLLRPEALAPFLDQMGAPTSALVASAIGEARQGRFDAILAAPAPDVPDMATAFLRGLGLFARGSLNEAAISFRAALRAEGDFFPAAFFLGACHAAAGHDTEAAGAWQTSLITQEDVPLVYEMLSDALVRLSRYREASDILEEAASRFPEHEPLEPRRAAVALGLGDAPAAFRRVAAFLERHPEDSDALFLALRLLYEAVSSERWILGPDEDVRSMEEYARRYRAAGGPHVALVERWLKR